VHVLLYFANNRGQLVNKAVILQLVSREHFDVFFGPFVVLEKRFNVADNESHAHLQNDVIRLLLVLLQ